ncbi:S8 family serine peptidase, partial [Deinococcus pimensis]|uniref:S8 family serine peptidase n=1 Tax=Deinococcus pimensis TaxID=309888 RepID=UPI0005EB8F1D
MIRAWAFLSLGVLLAACGSAPGVQQSSVNDCVRPTPAGALSVLSAADLLGTADWSAPRVAGQLLVLGEESSGGARALAASSALSDLRTEPVGETVRVFTPAGQSDEAFARRLAARGLRVQPNYRYEALAAPVPNDPGYPGGVVSNLAGGAEQSYLTRIGAKPAWDLVFDRLGEVRGALVAVLDTGVTATHEDLSANGATLLRAGRDFCATTGVGANGQPFCQGEDADPSEITGPYAGHGTSSAGIVGAAGNNGRGITGITWRPQNVLPVKVFGMTDAGREFADTASIAAGLNWAVSQNARVVNMSLGFVGCNPDPALAQAIRNAAGKDVVMVAAAGNNPAEGIRYPASDPLVIAVGALGDGDALASYSARPTAERDLDLVAPGGVGTGGSRDILSLGAGPREYRVWAGTSEAAPQVAGVAALVRAFAPTLKAD